MREQKVGGYLFPLDLPSPLFFKFFSKRGNGFAM
jgi:hypothetical protein